MKTLSRNWLGLMAGVSLLMLSIPAQAQLAPMGGHYAGRPSDTGDQPGLVNLSGGYSTSVPLDLPPVRGGLPLPLQISSGARGVGAAGLGWDIPISYIRRDTSFARRRPAFGDNVAPQAVPKVTLYFQGQALDLVPHIADWMPQNNSPQLLLREQNGAWLMFDGQGRTYNFTAPPGLAGMGLWLLTSVTGPGGTSMLLTYDAGTGIISGGSSFYIDLMSIQYNVSTDKGCYKHEIDLRYVVPPTSPLGGPPITYPLSIAMVGESAMARVRILSAIDVMSRESCTTAPQRLRRYQFTYLPDADTQAPQLSSVQMLGRAGTPEATVALPVANYGYGAALSGGQLVYQFTQTIGLPIGADWSKISSTDLSASEFPPTRNGYNTYQSLTDVTGDGRPDLVFSGPGNQLFVSPGRPGTGGKTVFDPAQAFTQPSGLTTGPFEATSAASVRWAYANDGSNTVETWRQAIDVNGDGRIDIIDAAETPMQWVVYLNTPGTGPSGIAWVRRAYSVDKLYQQLQSYGHHTLDPNYLPLARRKSGHDLLQLEVCLRRPRQQLGPDRHHWVRRCCAQLSHCRPRSPVPDWIRKRGTGRHGLQRQL